MKIKYFKIKIKYFNNLFIISLLMILFACANKNSSNMLFYKNKKRNKKSIKYELKKGNKNNYKYEFLKLNLLEKKPKIVKTKLKNTFYPRVVTFYLKCLIDNSSLKFHYNLEALILNFCYNKDDIVLIGDFENNYNYDINIKNIEETNKWIATIPKHLYKKDIMILKNIPSLVKTESINHLNFIDEIKYLYDYIDFNKKAETIYLSKNFKTKQITKIKISNEQGDLFFLKDEDINSTFIFILAFTNNNSIISIINHDVLNFPNIFYHKFEYLGQDIILELFNKKLKKYFLFFLHDFKPFVNYNIPLKEKCMISSKPRIINKNKNLILFSEYIENIKSNYINNTYLERSEETSSDSDYQLSSENIEIKNLGKFNDLKCSICKNNEILKSLYNNKKNIYSNCCIIL